MKFALRGLGTVLMFFGLLWFLQGTGLVAGSSMTGEMQWAVYGGIFFVAGLVMLVTGRRGMKPGRRPQ